MARPHRPNTLGPQVGADGLSCPARPARRRGHQKQETHREMKARKRAQAEARNAETPPERTRAFRREALRLSAQEASAWVA